ncbi:hypothetical protein D3879_06395 [Pseudomonas cavernicola]|uniref:Uncharacterized protein n=1 Tax=Pseudomonas cavernicola TaxID=2320866 RepID=A0A418XKE2_9PSED|nr:hypothetical protein [Pseudomonas cavernicola]RJG12906.1 hypothetical protein D3879_06395 [Pseudomonas cavernicola]
MEKIKSLIVERPYLAIGVAVALGIALSYFFGFFQRALLPIAEWARLSFIVPSSSPVLAENIVNFLYHLISFGLASVCVLLFLARFLGVRGLFYLGVVLTASQVICLRWVFEGVVFGFDPTLLPVLPLIPISVLAMCTSFALASFLVLRKPAL